MPYKTVRIIVCFVCCFLYCSTPQIRQDIKEQVDEAKAVAEKSQSVAEKTKAAASKQRSIGTQESIEAARDLDDCSDQLSACSANALKNSNTMKAMAIELDKITKERDGMMFFYKVGLIGSGAFGGIVLTIILYLVGRYLFKFSFLI